MSNHIAPVDRLGALVACAGFSSLYQLHRLLKLKLSVETFEAVSGVVRLERHLEGLDMEGKVSFWDEIQASFCYAVKKLDLKRVNKATFEVFDRESIPLIDVKETPIERVTPKGLELQDGSVHTFDIPVLATGFDGLTGAIVDLDMRGSDDLSIREK
ncbi:hypothetical protein J3R30DRAFT_3701067 [Lentinula aciculospora]|uniref:Uncharacterized protein n=1 Tax=Lentinula aciculospora TaxID=153920 RepID=A0A9W9DPD9_9AGAR|nr:hypothetical protein J3R30DRAFT_3704716 [Lentinula aciculospora]KAJ4479918.1 hypothetical protein J3R30DRAFT_3701067 [Lentinula aciculospora]